MRCNAVCLFEAQTIGIRQPLKSACPSTANRWCSTPMPKRKAMISSVSAAWIFPKTDVGCCTAPTPAGDERYDFRIRELGNRQGTAGTCSKGIGGACFTPDAQWVFYVKLDDAWRPYAVMRHRVGTPIDRRCGGVPRDRTNDSGWASACRSTNAIIVIGTGSKTTTEVLLLASRRLRKARSARSFRARPDVEYDVSFSLLRRRRRARRGYSARRGLPQRVEPEFRDRRDRHALPRAPVPAGRGRARGRRFAVRMRARRRGRTGRF